jgi:hypothetical protein
MALLIVSKGFMVLRFILSMRQIIVGAIGLGVYVSSKNQSHNAPTAIGGSANEKLNTQSPTMPTAAGGIVHSTSLHVQPTFTVARREEEVEPTSTGLPPVLLHERSSFEDANVVRVVPPSRHRRVNHNRSET